jgi:thiamine-phosphate pyrophosphorylase
MDLGLYVITASTPELGRDHIEVAAAAIEGGATAIQLRIKRRSMGEALKVANDIHELALEAGIPLLINDHVGIAMASKAEGLHTGPDDISLFAARRMLGDAAILGRSTEGKPADAIRVAKDGANYVAVGPVYPTSSKRTAVDQVGANAISKAKSVVKVPVVAIGGITAERVDACIKAGADGVAVMSAVTAAEDMVAATKELRKALDAARKKYR